MNICIFGDSIVWEANDYEKASPFISMSDVVNESDLEDGLHPNPIRHEKMFNKLKPEVEKVMKNLGE